MKPGSVIVDIAAGKGPDGVGGNCPLSDADQTVVTHGVTIVGETNLRGAGRRRRVVALRAQRARLPQARRSPRKARFSVPMDDDIVAACLMTQGGEVKRK